ncbi:HpcH/HpaI aldolase/citrate lyase family protein [Nocardia sp. NPDC059228]|uniref:HpcH/HpaI aldolase/citrate lyase family protein n=1 Tax=Nocardia sp. NPDC059228 TaxID=3346777 RepID=UPI0036A0D417
MRYPGTWLYVPGDRPDRMSKAMVSGAEVVVLDLQDAVAMSRKQQARATVAEFLTAAEPAPWAPRIHVRVNNVHTETGRRDLDAVAGLPALAGIRLPRVEAPADIESAIRVVGTGGAGAGFHCLIETAAGVENAYRIAAIPGVAAISLGEGDLRAELRALDEQALEWTRSRIVVAAAAAQLPPPAMAVFGNIKDAAGLRESCERGRRLGMRGRAAIHPAQLPIIAEAFAPTAAEVEQARRIVTEADAHAGGFALDDGTFVDQPVVAAARLTLEWAERYQPSSARGRDHE